MLSCQAAGTLLSGATHYAVVSNPNVQRAPLSSPLAAPQGCRAAQKGAGHPTAHDSTGAKHNTAGLLHIGTTGLQSTIAAHVTGKLSNTAAHHSGAEHGCSARHREAQQHSSTPQDCRAWLQRTPQGSSATQQHTTGLHSITARGC
jgi:hypothetical protein